MREKLTLEKFRELKAKFLTEYQKFSQLAEEQEEFIEQNGEEEFIKLYGESITSIINEIISYDLSDIPYEEWDGVFLFSFGSEPLDLSLTHGNFDFDVLEGIECPSGVNLKGCHLRHVEHLYPKLPRHSFDEEFISSHPDLFLSPSFSEEFETKFLTSKLEISDLLSLSDEQLIELSSKNNKNFLNYKNNTNSMFNYLIEYYNLPKALAIYKSNPEYLNELSIVLSYIHYGMGDSQEEIKSILQIESITEMMDQVDDYLAKYITNNRFNQDARLSNRFKNKYPNLFISQTELPREIYEKYTRFSLSLNDYLKYINIFNKGNFFTHVSSYTLQEIKDLIGSDALKEVLTEIAPMLLDKTIPFDIENDYQFTSILKKNHSILNDQYSSKDIFYISLVTRYYGDNTNLTFGRTTNSSIYEDTQYPEWIKKIGVYLQSINILEDQFIHLITSETYLNVNDRRLLTSLGLKNISRFHKEYGPLGKNLEIIAKYYSYFYDDKPINYEEFLDHLVELFKTSIRNQYYNCNTKIIDDLPESFTSIHPEVFLSKDAPEDLKKAYYTNRLSFGHLKVHPEWQQYLKNIKLTAILTLNQPTLDYSNESIGLLDYLYSIGATDKVYEYIIAYGNLLENISLNIKSLDNLTFAEIEDKLIDAVYWKISQRLEQKYSLFDAAYDENLPVSFKNRYPELFLSLDAPEELKTRFYAGSLSLQLLKEHPEWLPFLEGKTALNFSDLPKHVNVVDSSIQVPQMITGLTFADLYTKKYGLKALLDFLSPYSSIIHLLNNVLVDVKDSSKEGIERSIEKGFYSNIVKQSASYSDEVPESFKNEHPDIFIASNAPEDLKNKFYHCSLNYADLYKHPEYLEYLKNIKFSFAFRGVRITNNYLNGLPNEIAYKLICLFGNYITYDRNILDSLKDFQNFDQTDINIIKDKIIICLKNGSMSYSDDVPPFIKQEIPHMFLDDNAPEELKNYYYNKSNYSFSFTILKAHPEWQPFLQDKSILPFYYNSVQRYQKEIIDFINTIGGEKQFLKLGLQKPKDVDYMINHHKFDLLAKWYLKTGKKFVPDYVVMESFPFEEADKFLANGKSWSILMRSGNFKNTPEGVDALIKLAYSFGIFEGDPRAEKRLLSLISDLPRNLTPVAQNTIFQMEKTILISMVNPEATKNNMLIGLNEYKRLREVMQKEGFTVVEGKPVLPLIYHVGEDRQCRLIINEQQYPETSKWVRNFMEANNLRGMISPQTAHAIFGGFTLKYDPYFREFLLKNIDEILANPDYMTYIAAIQKQFDQIRIDNSNRALTLKLAVDYVQANKYFNVEAGNEDLARVSAIAGYTQEEFDTLQQIFNYGKLRTFSSIPRISSSKNEYTYEIPRLIDAFPTTAGTMSDCCQELGDCAELDMEHSMTSEHGRLFVIRDEEGKIAAQSWVWRNQNVLCFDNIEVPARAFERATLEKHLTREQFAQIIYDIYVKAAEELITADEKVYKKLLDEGKITEEQYNSLKLSKVTVGLGYNDIASAIQRNAELDKEPPKLPPKYEAPVPLQRPLYISDSRTQYVLSEKEGHVKPTDTITPIVHYDEFKEYDKDNINFTVIQTIRHLEAATSKRENYQLNCNFSDEENAFSELAYNYGVREDNLRLIITPNFSIVYEETPSNINILDLLVKTTTDVNNTTKNIQKEVYLQMKMAYLQLLNKDKKIDTSRMLNDVTNLYSTIESLDIDLDSERGISHGTR